MSSCVPTHLTAASAAVERLAHAIKASRRLMVLTGAGLSTESGIPDYRSAGVGLYSRSPDYRPVQHQEFLKSYQRRQNYWARNYMAWPKFSSLQPNTGHMILADWQRRGVLSSELGSLVTQNVDGLHHRAGSQQVVELHGCSYRVSCLRCGARISRQELQHLFASANPNFYDKVLEDQHNKPLMPDGDVALDEDQVREFRVPPCPSCHHDGPLKPDVVFFGDNVPHERRDLVMDRVSASDTLLVIGSSLHVFSGFRLALHASKSDVKLLLLNIGPNRADALADLKVEGATGDVLSKVDRLLR